MILQALSPRVSDINEQKLRPIPQCASAKVAVALLRCKATPGLDDIADPGFDSRLSPSTSDPLMLATILEGKLAT